eukprot:261334-Chlamydomonas_euryale.AAC.9
MNGKEGRGKGREGEVTWKRPHARKIQFGRRHVACGAQHARAARAHLCLDITLHLVARPVAGDNLRRRGPDRRVGQQLQRAGRLERRIHRAHGRDAAEAQQLLHVRVRRVHQQVHEFAVLAAHLVGVHDLVAPPGLKDRLEEGLVVGKVAVAHQFLAAPVVLRDKQARQDRADVLDLLRDSRDVDAVGVLRHVERSLEQAQQAALVLRGRWGGGISGAGAVGHARRASDMAGAVGRCGG